MPKTVSRIIEELRKNNGAELDPAVWDSKKKKAKKRAKKKAKKKKAKKRGAK